jgi:hypothetical protein
MANISFAAPNLLVLGELARLSLKIPASFAAQHCIANNTIASTFSCMQRQAAVWSYQPECSGTYLGVEVLGVSLVSLPDQIGDGAQRPAVTLTHQRLQGHFMKDYMGDYNCMYRAHFEILVKHHIRSHLISPSVAAS